MEEAADESGKVFSMVFNQRTLPVYKTIKEIVSSGEYGALKRVNWVVTDWYRPELYYKSSSWHATWDKDGGGVLLNQCPHNLDLLQWICGNPKCGHIAIMDKNGALYCPVCKKTNVYLVQTSYAFKLLMDELLSLGVAMRLQLEDLR